jgi:hypothetical protein
MDIGIIAAVIMLVVWAVLTFTTEAPGYVHLLLTIGFFVLFWRIAVRGSGKPASRTGGKTGRKG